MSDEVLSQEEIEALISQGGAGAAQAQADAASSAEEQAIGDEQQAEAGEGSPPEITARSGSVRPVELNLVGPESLRGPSAKGGMDLILDVQLQVTVELGRATMKVREVLGLGPGAVVELDKHAGEPVDVVVNNKPIARGEVVVIDENFGVRVTEIIDKEARDARAKAA